MTAPMIWPEFRFHSIIFATRHVIATVFTLNNAWPLGDTCGTNLPGKLGLVLTTILCARYITVKYGDKDKRTTNSMPYPKEMKESEISKVKYQYAKSQFSATCLIFYDEPTFNFIPLLGIQAAPLLMTLVRKGKITSITYHLVYATTLWLGYVTFFWTNWNLLENKDTFFVLSSMFAYLVGRLLRLRFRFSQSFIWSFITLVMFTIHRFQEDFNRSINVSMVHKIVIFLIALPIVTHANG